MRKIFKNGNLTVELNKSKVIPDDPGADTPALVFWRGFHTIDGVRRYCEFSSTFWCAAQEGELDSPYYGTYQLSEPQSKWLDSLERKVNEFLY